MNLYTVLDFGLSDFETETGQALESRERAKNSWGVEAQVRTGRGNPLMLLTMLCEHSH